MKCHHGARECAGNKLLTCIFRHYQNSPNIRFKLFNCFMSQMMHRASIPAENMNKCLDNQSGITPQIKAKIL